MFFQKMHNMSIEDERDLEASIQFWKDTPTCDVNLFRDETTRFDEYLARYKKLR